MSTSFFIAPFDSKAWRVQNDISPKPVSELHIDTQDYQRELVKRWRGITFSTVEGSRCLLRWRLPPEDAEYGGLVGCLQSNAQIVAFGTGPKNSFVDFILWHRSFVPDVYHLFLFNSSAWETESLILTNNTSEQDIVAFTGIIS